MVLVGDWGSGHPHAQDIAKLMAEDVEAGLAGGLDVHVIHLGDVSHAGLPAEYRDHVLGPRFWPVTPEPADTSQRAPRTRK